MMSDQAPRISSLCHIRPVEAFLRRSDWSGFADGDAGGGSAPCHRDGIGQGSASIRACALPDNAGVVKALQPAGTPGSLFFLLVHQEELPIAGLEFQFEGSVVQRYRREQFAGFLGDLGDGFRIRVQRQF